MKTIYEMNQEEFARYVDEDITTRAYMMSVNPKSDLGPVRNWLKAEEAVITGYGWTVPRFRRSVDRAAYFDSTNQTERTPESDRETWLAARAKVLFSNVLAEYRTICGPAGNRKV